MLQKRRFKNKWNTNDNKKACDARHRISEGISMDGSSKKVRRFTQGGGGCRRLRGWRVFDGFESYAGRWFGDFDE